MSEKWKPGNSAGCGLGTDSWGFNFHWGAAFHWTKFPASTLLWSWSADSLLTYIVGLCTASQPVSQDYGEECKLGLPNWVESLFKALQLRLISSHTFFSKKKKYNTFPQKYKNQFVFLIWFPFINFTCLLKLMFFCLLLTRTAWLLLETISSNEFP